MDKTLYTARELASYLNCNVQTIYRMADRGELESIKVGNLRRFVMPDKETKQCYRREKGC